MYVALFATTGVFIHTISAPLRLIVHAFSLQVQPVFTRCSVY